jgi:hypothetical protein
VWISEEGYTSCVFERLKVGRIRGRGSHMKGGYPSHGEVCAAKGNPKTRGPGTAAVVDDHVKHRMTTNTTHQGQVVHG